MRTRVKILLEANSDMKRHYSENCSHFSTQKPLVLISFLSFSVFTLVCLIIIVSYINKNLQFLPQKTWHDLLELLLFGTSNHQAVAAIHSLDMHLDMRLGLCFFFLIHVPTLGDRVIKSNRQNH